MRPLGISCRNGINSFFCCPKPLRSLSLTADRGAWTADLTRKRQAPTATCHRDMCIYHRAVTGYWPDPDFLLLIPVLSAPVPKVQLALTFPSGVIVFTHETDLRKSDRYPLRLLVQVRTPHAQLTVESQNI